MNKDQIFSVINYLTDGLLVFDENKALVLINPQAEKLLDVQSKEVIGRQILELNDSPQFQVLITLLGGGIKECDEKEIRLKESLILKISAVTMKVGKEEVGRLVILRNITEYKLVERMKSEFITLAAHQLRTPSSIVKWTTKSLLDGDLGELTQEQKEAVQKTYDINDKMIRLVSDLLNVAEIEQGKYLSKLSLLDIEEIVQSVVGMYKDIIEEKKIKFEFEKSEKELPKLMLDKEKMSIAIKNLVENAVKYTFQGGKVKIFIKNKGNEVEIQIQDTGLGIPENQQSKVFTNFFRGSNIMKVDTEGTGLGLFMAKNIIEAHGGKIGFESIEGKGSLFYFTIPVKKQFAEFMSGEFY